jgi:hypothetical protein
MKRAFLLGLLVLPLASCITRQVKEPIFEQDRTSVFLRSERKLGSTLPKGYGHPLQLSAARMAHILSRIDLRTGEGDANRRAAIPLDQLYVIADGMAQAFSKAGPDQEVVSPSCATTCSTSRSRARAGRSRRTSRRSFRSRSWARR